MTIRCEQLDDLLLEGDRFSMETAARHAEGCEACMERLAAWNEISSTAHSMQTTWQSDMLWPRIERALEKEKRGLRTQWWQIAAAILLTVGLAAVSWYAIRLRSRDAAYDTVILRESAVDEVEKAERQHVAAIEQLEKVAEPQLEDAETPLMISYKEKLMLLDDAIAECQQNIEHNRQNAHVRKQLLAMYGEKQRTLQAVVREGSHASNQ